MATGDATPPPPLLLLLLLLGGRTVQRRTTLRVPPPGHGTGTGDDHSLAEAWPVPTAAASAVGSPAASWG
jgi:hypothetical protein